MGPRHIWRFRSSQRQWCLGRAQRRIWTGTPSKSNPLTQFPGTAEAATMARGKQIFSTEVARGGAGCASCHHKRERDRGWRVLTAEEWQFLSSAGFPSAV